MNHSQEIKRTTAREAGDKDSWLIDCKSVLLWTRNLQLLLTVGLLLLFVSSLSDCDFLNASQCPAKPSPIDTSLTVTYASTHRRVKCAVICDSLCCRHHRLVPFAVCFLYISVRAVKLITSSVLGRVLPLEGCVKLCTWNRVVL